VVYIPIDGLLYIAVGNEDYGDLALSNVLIKFYGICCTVLKKSPDDPEQILKNLPKLSLHFEELLAEDGYGVNGLFLEELKLKR